LEKANTGLGEVSILYKITSTVSENLPPVTDSTEVGVDRVIQRSLGTELGPDIIGKATAMGQL
jgi:hypothetical protein